MLPITHQQLLLLQVAHRQANLLIRGRLNNSSKQRLRQRLRVGMLLHGQSNNNHNNLHQVGMLLRGQSNSNHKCPHQLLITLGKNQRLERAR